MLLIRIFICIHSGNSLRHDVVMPLMNDEVDMQSHPRPRLSMRWVVAVLAVVVVWAGAYALRGGTEKHILPGWVDGLTAGQHEAERSGRPMVLLLAQVL